MIERVMQLIKQSGLSDNAFEKQLHLSQGTVGNWRSGRNKLSMEAIIKLARYFNISADYLLGLSDEPKQLIATSEELTSAAIIERPIADLAEKYKHLFTDEEFMKIAKVYEAAQDVKVKGLLVGYFIATAKASGVDTTVVGY